ncbi:MAG TPA: TonB-dependent receptor [Butyricimonas virosa]|uniref:TonB-dependent receptor n=1 Tax=Butyricimonas virosa TaxID=544645 RepID=A0A921KY22_9BACT|nr:TonB-dependent receptor [Butyricimonas virosa]
MKKNGEMRYLPRGGCVKKWLLFMRNFLIIFLMSSMSLYASQVTMAQKISIKVNNVNLKVVIEAIEQQTKFGFLYNENEVRQVKNLSLNVKDMDVAKVLDLALKGSSLVYSIEQETILISTRERVVGDTVKPMEEWVIRGRVTDKKSGPLPGVSVYIKGTTKGVATDSKGEYKLVLAPQKNLVLMYSFVGMKMKEVPVSKPGVVNVVLEDDVSDLDEVRVIAYGKTTKREMMGAVTSIKGEDILSVPTANLSSLLQGRVAGMDVSNMSGAPGSGGTATILRGYNTLSAEQRDFSSPLWVIDGVPITNLTSTLTGTNALAEIDPESIESIEVLKDAAATSMYGSRAANGVILVTTKKGKAGQRSVRANVSYSWSYIPEYPTVFAGKEARRYKLKALRNYRTAYMNAEGEPVYPTSYTESYHQYQSVYNYFWGDGNEYNAGAYNAELQDSLNPFYNNATNWFKRFFQTGKVLTANVQSLYGTDKFNCSVGAGFYDETGILRKSGFIRFNFMTNLGFKPADRLTIDVNIALAYAKRARNQGETSNLVMGSGDNLINVPNTPFETSTFLPANSVVEDEVLKNQKGVKEKNEDMAGRLGVVLSYNIADWLRFSTTNSIGYTLSKQNKFTPLELMPNKKTESAGTFLENRVLLTENLLVFNKEFKEHKVEVLAGISVQLSEEHSVGGLARGGPGNYVHYASGGWPSIDNSGYLPEALTSYKSNFEKDVLISYLGRLTYSYKQKYIFGASVRRDGSSKFGKAKPWGTFPAFSAAWVFSDEKFMDFLGWLDFGKLRGSWGETGTQFTTRYLAYGSLSAGMIPFMGNSTVVPQSANGLLNPDLSWETTRQYNVGIDLDFLNYRLGVVFDFYGRYTYDMMYAVSLPGDYSPFTTQYKNAGAISNEGIELSLKYDIFRRDNLKWRLNFNIARNWNKFKKSYDDRDLGTYILGRPLNVIRRLKASGIIQSEDEIPYKYNASGQKQYLYPNMYQGVRQFYTVGDIKYYDADGDGTISTNGDAIYIGSPLPLAQGGILTELQWKGFDVALNFTYSLGRTIINGNKAEAVAVSHLNILNPILEDIRKYTFWEKPGDDADFPRLAYDTGKNNTGIYSDQFVEKVNYLRLRSFVLGYSLPKSITDKLKLTKIRAYVSGENLFTWTNYSGMDPEAVDLMTGFDNIRKYPLNRKFTLGLSVNF